MNRHDKSVEQTLRDFQLAAAGSTIMRQKLLALRFYLHSLISQSQTEWVRKQPTNYDAFLALAEGGGFDRIHLLTFNYDTLLDLALSRHLSTPLDPNAFQHKYYSLVHCHGSLNWGYEVITPMEGGHGDVCARIVSAEKLDLGPLTMFDKNSNAPHGHDKPVVPALAIPVEPKSEFICPKEHVDAIAGDLPHITKVVVVGWRGVEEHVQQLLSSLPPNVRGLVVSGSEKEANDTIDELKLPGSIAAAAGGFTRSLYITNQIQEFIES